ncbi:PH domain-containing protein [Mycena venus]|uniref:PH domain-containing protein n=1 Tax=Mycena venus TaxID=2733690 RepID=A0A8H6Z665_9AGAR|nr:PH domain-containing protein [Mycena venus]
MDESSDVATLLSLVMSSVLSESVDALADRVWSPSTIYDAPSEVSSMPETSLTSTLSNLTLSSRALWTLRRWCRGSSGTHDSSILAPFVGSIMLHDTPDTSGETSFLRPTESFSSWDRLSTIPRSVTSEFMLPLPLLLPLPSSSLSDVSTPSSFKSDSSSSLGRMLSLLTQSLMLSDDFELPLPEEEPLPDEEPPTIPSLSMPQPSRPPSSVTTSTRSLRRPEASGSMTVSTLCGNALSVRCWKQCLCLDRNGSIV